jgi:hypothetical protein
LSDPNQPADGVKRPLDLKSRLRTSAPAPGGLAGPGGPGGAPAPATSGTLPPPPSSSAFLPPPPARVAKVEAPTAETIEAARRRAEEHAREAGPAFEEFSIGGAPDKTPVPTMAQGGRVEYVDVPVHELTPEMKQRQRNLVLGVSVGAALVAFLLGLAFSSAGALSQLKENMIFEADEKLASLTSQQPNFDRMKALAADLKAFNDQVVKLNADNEKAAKDGAPLKELASLEKDVVALIGKVNAFVEAKPAIDPGTIIGTAVYNGPLMSTVLSFAQRTQVAAAQATALLEEAQTLVSMWNEVPPEQQTVLVFVEPTELPHPEFGKVVMGKGRVIKDFGKVAKVDVKAADGRPAGVEHHQMVVLDGEKDPKQVKTSQVSQTDLGPFFKAQLSVTKNATIARLVELSGRLQKSLEGCSPDGTISEIKKFLATARGDEPAGSEEPPPAE